MLNRTAFFDEVRGSLFGGNLTQGQVDGINVILDEWQRRKLTQKQKLAYILATAFHETGQTMQPIYERGRKSYFAKYEPSTRIGKNLGNTIEGDGYRFRGRGFVQITGRSNYRRLGDRLSCDLVNNPDQALEPAVAVQIMFEGMLDGLFTGKKLADYIAGEKCDYKNARRIVNRLDKAAMIADYASKFEEALLAVDILEPSTPKGEPKQTFVEALIKLIRFIFGRRDGT